MFLSNKYDWIYSYSFFDTRRRFLEGESLDARRPLGIFKMGDVVKWKRAADERGEYLFSLFLVDAVFTFFIGDGDWVCNWSILPGDIPICNEARRDILWCVVAACAVAVSKDLFLGFKVRLIFNLKSPWGDSIVLTAYSNFAGGEFKESSDEIWEACDDESDEGCLGRFLHLWSSMQGISVSTGMYTVTDCFWIVACGCFKISLSSCERRCSCLANGVKDTPVGKDNLLFARGEITSDNLTSSINK